MKKFFTKIKNWFVRHKPSKRRLIQVYAALLYNANIKGFITGNIYVGNTKITCVPGLNCYSCPGAVGACPLGALQNALAATDTKAPYYVLGILALFGIMLGRTICGFLCPVGLGQELLYKIKTPKLKKSKATRVLSYFKYVLLIVLVIVLPIFLSSPTFCKYICPAGTFGGAGGLLANPQNADFFDMLSGLFTWKFALLVIVIVASIFIYRFFCRFACPLGAIYGFFNKFAILGVKFDKDKCTDCGLCITHCKMDVKHVGDHECINCGECISVCPTQAISWKGSKIFLHANAVEDEREEAKPLNSILEAGTTLAAADSAETHESVSQTEELPEATETPAVEAETAETVEEKEVVSTAKKPLTVRAKEKRRNKILEIAAWSLALVFLIFVFVYYNFLVKDPEVFVYGVGDKCPVITSQLYNPETNGDEDGKFVLTEERGKVVVINFWATWCNPCVAEIPHFNELQKKYSDEITVVAFHQINPADDVQAFIEEKGWDGYDMLFAQDEEVYGAGSAKADLFSSLGGKRVWPMTIILDGEGRIVFSRQGSMTFEALDEAVSDVLNK